METNNIIAGVYGVEHLYSDIEEKGCAKIKTYTIDENEIVLYNLRAMRDGGSMFYVNSGKYVKLLIDGHLMMSDMGMERRSNRNFIQIANGRVLIAGLGIGLIIHNILQRKPINDRITEIIVIEKYQDVIDLVAPKFNDPRLKIICADIFDWKPNKGEKFDTIYFDIWPDICEDNLIEIKQLHNKFKSYLNRNNTNAWMDSWLKDFLQAKRRRNY